MRMRKKKHSADRLNALSAMIIQNMENLYKNPHQPFGNTGPLRLEIGCGKGDFIIGTAQREPEYHYYAMEKITDVLVMGAEKYACALGLGQRDPSGGWTAPDGTVYQYGEELSFISAENAGNVRFLNADASALPTLFPANTFSCIYLNFSDPWHKKGYAKRRLTHLRYLQTYAALLQTGGELRVKTDNTALFAFTLEQLAEVPFRVTWQTRDLHNSDRAETNIMTEYERNFSSQGIPIHALTAVVEK